MVTYHLPAGPMNLETIFPSVDFALVEEYYLELKDQADDSTILTTNLYERGCCCSEDTVRVFFVNYLGGIDAINFKKIGEETGTTSSLWKKPQKYPLEKWDGGSQRFNVQSNEVLTLENNCFGEEDQEWIKELIGTPNAWLQWIGPEDLDYAQEHDYIPIVIRDDRFVTRKSEGRYEYVLRIQVEMANENIILRN